MSKFKIFTLKKNCFIILFSFSEVIQVFFPDIKKIKKTLKLCIFGQFLMGILRIYKKKKKMEIDQLIEAALRSKMDVTSLSTR